MLQDATQILTRIHTDTHYIYTNTLTHTYTHRYAHRIYTHNTNKRHPPDSPEGEAAPVKVIEQVHTQTRTHAHKRTYTHTHTDGAHPGNLPCSCCRRYPRAGDIQTHMILTCTQTCTHTHTSLPGGASCHGWIHHGQEEEEQEKEEIIIVLFHGDSMLWYLSVCLCS